MCDNLTLQPVRPAAKTDFKNCRPFYNMSNEKITHETPERHWRTQKAKLKLMFPHLLDEDFHYDYGEKDLMMDNLQAKLQKSREELNLLLTGL